MRVIMLTVLATAGCTSTVTVSRITPATKPDRTGIPYYLPKKYLLLAWSDGRFLPKVVETIDPVTGKPAGRTTTQEWIKFSEPRWVADLVELPDLREKYGITMVPGLGSSEMSIKLTDGWKLSELNLESDTQLDELVTALGQAIPALGSIVGAKAQRDRPPVMLFEFLLDPRGDLTLKQVDTAILGELFGE
jgi:hypothetical protein